jgi:hypothetical protein
MLDRALGLGVVARPGGELAEAHGAQLAAERLLGDRDPELLPQPLAQVDEAPAHHAVDGGRRAALDRRRQRRPVRVVQPGWLAGGLAVAQPARALGVEPQHPVADDLQRHPADPGRLGPRRPVVDRRQRQQPARLRGVLRPPRRGTQCRRVEVVPERDGHGEPPPFAISNQKTAARGIPSRVTASGTWYKPTESLDAYDLYLRALPHHYCLTRRDNDAALALLRRAIALDPAYALAKGLLGSCHALRVMQGWLEPGDREEAVRLAHEVLAGARDEPRALAYAARTLG